jgi:hypothetical protein
MDDDTSNAQYTPHDIRLSRLDSARWDRSAAGERRDLIAKLTDAALSEQSELDGCAVRIHHADGRLLAKTVLHKPLFVSAG